MHRSPTLLFLVISCSAPGFAECSSVAPDTGIWRDIDQQYSKIEHAMLARDAKALFSVYAPDFEAHNFDGSVWKFKDSAAYSTAGFDQVKENIHLSNTIIGIVSCSPGQVKATVLQQWTRMQESFGKVRRYETTTVQDETWILAGTEWKRKLVNNERPGAWYIDGKRVDTNKPWNPAVPDFDPHRLFAPPNDSGQRR